MDDVQKILVPVDFSSESADSLKAASSLARKMGAEITVLHVLDRGGRELRNAAREYLSSDREFSVPYLGPPLFSQDRWRREKSSDLDEFIRTTLGEHSEVTIRSRIEIGNPVNTILRVAGEERMDLMVVAKKWTSLIFHVTSRSILLKFALKSCCPVLLVGSASNNDAKCSLFRSFLLRYG